MQMVLTPLVGGEQIVLDKAILLFGRQPDCDVVIGGSRKVSRKHCVVAQIHDYFVVRDLGSMNGVRVNSNRVEVETKLKAGDTLTIGDVDFRLEMAEVPKRSSKPSKTVWVGKPEEGVRRAPSHLVSRDIPIAVPEDEVDFIIEEEDQAEATLRDSRPKPKSKTKHKSVRGKAKSRQKPGDDEVIVLGDDDIIA